MTDPREWGEWPCCPRCGQRRQTVCPSCGTAGNRFPLADYLAPGEPLRSSRPNESRPNGADQDAAPRSQMDHGAPTAEQRVWLVCPQCDEAFVPRFYRHCAACGFDSGSGMDVPGADTEVLSQRVRLVIYGLVLLCGLLLLYFWFLFRKQ